MLMNVRPKPTIVDHMRVSFASCDVLQYLEPYPHINNVGISALIAPDHKARESAYGRASFIGAKNHVSQNLILHIQ